MFSIAVVLIVLAVVIVLVITRKAPLIAVGLFIIAALTITGLVKPADAFIHLADKSIMLFIGAFIIGDAFARVGLIDTLGEKALVKSQGFKNESLSLLLICLITAGLSSVLSSLGVQVAMMSLILAMADTLKISKRKAMVALGYAAGIGGMMTMIGTPLNMVGKSAYETLVPGDTIGIFEISRLSVPMGLVMILFFCFAGKGLISSEPVALKAKVQKPGGAKPARGRTYTRQDRIYVVCVFAAFIILVTLDGCTPIPSNIVWILAAFALGLRKISTVQNMLDSIEWGLLLFIAGLTTLSRAIETSGLSDVLSQGILRTLHGITSDHLIVAAVFVVCAAISQLMSNAAAFSITMPFLPLLADTLDVGLKPLMLTAMIASSCGFILPISTPSYPMLAEAGDVKPKDWFRCGMPLLLIGLAACVLFIPALWPL